MKIGIIIQGPMTTYGNGPNNAPMGFDARNCINSNINKFAPLVDKIVISTWTGSGLSASEFGHSVRILENTPITDWDYDNQRKQFYSTSQAVDWLSKNTSCTHVIKIRTDQDFPVELIDWVYELYQSQSGVIPGQSGPIVFSEGIKQENFYIGDFIFIAAIDDMKNLCDAVLNAGKQLHPINANDYVLKFISRVIPTSGIGGAITNSIALAKNHRNFQNLWIDILKNHITVLPKEIYKKIIWRGRPMPEVLPSLETAFYFHGDIQAAICNDQVWSAIVNCSDRSLKKMFRLFRKQWSRYIKTYYQYCILQAKKGLVNNS
ncbi:hypothetical protein [Polynucleobacter sp. AP-Feld-500C-C5]|uniref:hypothetical protein n=1 Tax=Polynucleobacter sp. AP-Feld-500C-C5 TaxID=2576924 RepID=UPI001C0DD557|nr:hypothetical protein [Polynucleobacter sp. AP-Feld-500C-C5]MBU3632843.1 hypothetical protein [Polynucleobacter sp. AP-Feld-500C-C5]